MNTKRELRRLLALMAALTLAVSYGGPAANGQELGSPTTSERLGGQRRAAFSSSNRDLAGAESVSRAFQAAADRVLPAVVKVRTTVTTERQTVMLRGLFPMEVPGQQQEGLGSGVIIDSKGIILTNNHVVKDASQVIVELQDGTELYGTEYATDPLTDLAIVRVRTNRALPTAQLGDSEQLRVGDWVLAVGHPLELETSVSAGIISAKGRSLKKVPRAQFLQTDAAINPGNSGGPLINLRGEVIGINTAIASQTGGYQGIGFAVPANLARDVVRQLRENGAVARGYLGVTLQELTNDLAQQLVKRAEFRGVVVNEVKPGLPADKAGMQVGDVITHFADFHVDSPSALQRAVERVPVGSAQTLRFVRFGRPMQTSVSTLQFNPRAVERRFRNVARKLSIPVHDNSTLGIEVANLSELARRSGYSVDGNAVVVTRVARGGLGEKEGIVPGMFIKQIRDQPLRNVDQFYQALRGESLNDGVLLLVQDTDRDSEQGERFVVIRSIQ